MKIRTAFLIIVACLVIIPSLSQAQLYVDPKNQPEPKMRSIRAGNSESLSSIRADALQTMDFGLEIMGDDLKMTNHLEYIVIFKWEETRDKYRSLWNNTWTWFENVMKEKKLDMTKDKEWLAKYNAFLDSVITDGEAVVYWKWREEIYRNWLELDIKSMPKELTELKNTVKEANTLLTDAQALANKSGATAADIDQALDKVEMADNLMEKVARQLEKTREFVKKERDKKKTSLDSNITQVRDRLKNCPSNHPDIMNQYTRRVSKWADVVDDYWDLYKKTWVRWEEIVKPVMADDLLKDYGFFKDVKYADLTKVTEQARQNLEAMK
jgi:hypothetical protein